MRKILSFLIAAILFAGIFFILKSAFPKYTGIIPFILVLLLLDIYLWFTVRKKIPPGNQKVKYLVISLYWLPMILLGSSFITGLVVPFKEWNIAWRTYLMGIITIVYVTKFIIIVFLFLSDIIRVVQFFYFVYFRRQGIKFTEIRRSSYILMPGWILGSGFFLLFMCGMIFWNFDFRIKQELIHLPELPSSFEGTRIIQISDIHLGSWSCPGKLRDAVAMINSQNPDLVFFTGDLVNYTSYEARDFADILKRIRAPLGIYAIMGNHDYGEYVAWPSPEAKMKNLEYLHELYSYLGWKLLLNENVIIHSGSDSIAITGVENWGGTARFPRLGDLDKAVKGTENIAVQLLLSHDPSHWEKVVKKGFNNIDVTFSGHTHGFQFGLECCGIRWSPSQYLYKQWAGLYSEPVTNSHPHYLYVNRGLGSIGYPGRIGILPEITLFILRK